MINFFNGFIKLIISNPMVLSPHLKDLVKVTISYSVNNKDRSPVDISKYHFQLNSIKTTDPPTGNKT